MVGSQEEDSKELLAEELLRRILDGMGVSAQIEIRRKEGALILCIEGCSEAGRIIGRGGNVLHQIQFLLNLMIMKKLKCRMNVVVDVGGYRERRRNKLIGQAHDAAEKVKRKGRPVVLEPMHSADRRIVHVVLRDDPLVETTSVNDDRETGMKCVRVFFRRKPPPSPSE